MGSIGETLRSTREAKGITLSQAEDDTKIRKRYLQALEEDDYDVIPGRVYAKGFLRNYANYLGLDAEGIMVEYKLLSIPAKEDAPARVNLEDTLNKRRSNGRSENRSDRRAYLITLLIALLAILTLVIYNYVYKNPTKAGLEESDKPAVSQPAENPDTQDKTTPPAGNAGQGQKPGQGGSSQQVPPAGGAGAGLPGNNGTADNGSQPPTTGVNLTLKGKDQECWAKVSVDGVTKFVGTIKAGETKTFEGTQNVMITLGNAGAVEVIENGKSFGTLGTYGQIIRNRQFNGSGQVVTPVPAATTAPATDTSSATAPPTTNTPNQ